MPSRSKSRALAALLLTAFSVLVGGSKALRDVNGGVRVLLVHLHPSVDASDPRIRAENDILDRELDLPGDAALLERAARRQIVRSVLAEVVSDVQERVGRFIQANVADSAVAVEILPLWIQNTLIVRVNEGNGSRPRPQRRFFEDDLRWFPGVVDVELDGAFVRLVSSEEDAVVSQPEAHLDGAQENIKLLHAPKLWAKGIRGQGVVVGSIDSGVRYSHEALKSSFRGTLPNGSVSFDYSFWFIPGTDVSRETPDTADEVGHGTHTVGTAVGGNGVGVAPEATWIAARAFDVNGAANKSDFLLAAQWVICPTRTDGSGENCSKGADVLVNSFGIDRSDADFAKWTWMDQVVHVWQAAGIYPVFASGNTNGFLCGSVYYPASRVETIAVGALMGGHSLWGASGKGPVTDGSNTIIKPDFVAPGVAIRSALSTKDTAYTRMTGTSMATPHIAGAIALLLSIPHGGSPSEKWGRQPPSPKLIGALQSSTTRGLSKPFLVPSECGNTTYKQFPNNICGWGLANVCAAASKLGVACSTSYFQPDDDLPTSEIGAAAMEIE